MKILVTGGAGFIGSALVRHIIHSTDDAVVNVDKLTYAGNLRSLSGLDGISSRHVFERVDICDRGEVERVFWQHRPDVVMHLAAESHVDRSIDSPSAFIQTNIVGTHVLLDVARDYGLKLPESHRSSFRFHHISTDEIFGDLDADSPPCVESTPYAPSSPYSASKASADHLVRAWHRTYGLPTLITNCSNNYGPYHFPEKLIPLTILNALEGRRLPVYGDGQQVRDWLYVEDHVRALLTVVKHGHVGQTYNIGGNNERRNIDVVCMICDTLQLFAPERPAGVLNYKDLIIYVKDRPGHDRRYAICSEKIQKELGWQPRETFETGIHKTVQWYLENLDWCRGIVKEHSKHDEGSRRS